jgi:putative cell wall-binding protein
VLVTPQGGLSPAVRAEVARLAPIGAYVIGSKGWLSDQVMSDLAATGIPQDQVIRLAGPTPADTAAAIANAIDRRTAVQKATAGFPAFDAAVIVNPASPDAAAISALAANRRFPVLLTAANALPAATAQALKDLGITRTIVIGTNQFVNASVLAALPNPQRLGGSNAVATSRTVVAQSRRWGLPTNIVFSTNMTRRMDAAVMGAAVARIGGLLLLSPGGAPEAQKVLDQLKMRTMVDRLFFADRSRAPRR